MVHYETMRAGLFELIRLTLLIVGALMPIVNPLGNAPIFLVLTHGVPSSTRALLARKIAINGFVLLVCSTLIGTYILAFFGISLPVVQVGGGLVVLSTGWTLLHREDDDEDRDAPERPASLGLISRQAFYPLTLPLTVGPGSISVAITLGANRPERTQFSWPILSAEVLGPAVLALTIFLCYRYAERIAHAVGDAAMNVIVRLSSFMLLCIGVQILWNGVSALMHSSH
jgi:multiple antibiotic resistance protein